MLADDTPKDDGTRLKHGLSILTVSNQTLDRRDTFKQHLRNKLPTRYTILLLCMITNLISYCLRTNLNLTIVSMVEHKDVQISQANVCPDANSHVNHSQSMSNATEVLAEELFDWSESTQGIILGSYFYGYIVTNINAGQLAQWTGVKLLLSLAMAFSAIMNLLIPVSAQLGPAAVVVVRLLTGLAQGVITPSIYALLTSWTPRDDLGLAYSLIAASGFLGAMLTMPISAALVQLDGWRWPAVFYFFGIIGIIFVVPWHFLIYNTPHEHPRIDDIELVYLREKILVSSKSSKTVKKSIPWASIATSRKIWLISITKFCSSWGCNFLMSKLPAYLESVLRMDISYNSYINSSIYITLGASLILFGRLSDFIEHRHLLDRTFSRRMFQSIALVGGALFLALVPVFGCNVVAVIIMLNLSMVVYGFIAGGESVIISDVAVDYSGTIYGITNSIASFPGFAAPYFIGVMLDQGEKSNPMWQWSIIFWISSAIYIFGAFVFLFVSSEPEEWATFENKDEENAESDKMTAEEKSLHRLRTRTHSIIA